MGAMLPPIPPSMGIRHHSKKHWCLFGGFGFSAVNLRQQFTAEKRTRAPLTISWLKSAVCKEVFPSLTSPSKTANMKQSKKGACSSNTQTAKANCLAHNRRDNSTEKVPSYVNKNRSHLNRTIFEDDIIKGRKSIVPLVHAAEKLYTEKTGQKCQKSFAPFREACLHLKEGITDEQLMEFKVKVERETKWKVIGIWLHEDEGHAKSKYIEGNEGFSINHHAHVLFSCQDLNTGKAIRVDRTKLSHMQDILAEATGMERGNKAAETGRRHRSAMEQRIYSQEQRVKELEEMAIGKEKEVAVVDEKRKKLWQEFSFISKKNKEKLNTLYDKEREIEKVILSLSKAQKELETTNSAVESQKRLVSQINTQIKEFTDKLQGQQKEYDEKALKIAHFNSVLENYKEQQSILYEVAKQKISVFGISAYELLANTAGELQQIYKKKAEQLNNNVNDAISRIVDFSHNAAKKGFSQEDYMVFDSVLGKENRESKARYLIERAEEKIGFSSYIGKNIVHRDILDFARDNTVSLRTERGRGIGY